MSEKEIKDLISGCISEFYCNDLELDVLKICEKLNERISEVEKRLEETKEMSWRALKTAEKPDQQ